MLATEVTLAVDARFTALSFLGVLGFLALLVIIFVVKSVFDQRKYSKASLPSLGKEEPEDGASANNDSATSVFALAEDEDETPLPSGNTLGTELKDLPGVTIPGLASSNASDSRLRPEPGNFEPEENALPVLAPMVSVSPSSVDEQAQEELLEDEADEEFTPVLTAGGALEFDDAQEESIDKIFSGDLQEENTPTAEEVNTPPSEENVTSAVTPRQRNPISIPTITDETIPLEDSPYRGKRRAAATVDSATPVTKEEN